MKKVRKLSLRALALVAVFACVVCLLGSCTSSTDVSADPEYQRGWIPGNEYVLIKPAGLTEYDMNGTKTRNIYPKVDRPVGTVIGKIDGSDEVVVARLPPGTRIRVERLQLYEPRYLCGPTPPPHVSVQAVLVDHGGVERSVPIDNLSTRIENARGVHILQRDDRFTVSASTQLPTSNPITAPSSKSAR